MVHSLQLATDSTIRLTHEEAYQERAYYVEEKEEEQQNPLRVINCGGYAPSSGDLSMISSIKVSKTNIPVILLQYTLWRWNSVLEE